MNVENGSCNGAVPGGPSVTGLPAALEAADHLGGIGQPLPMAQPAPAAPCGCGSGPAEPGRAEAACCGGPVAPASSDLERPGYILWPFVERFISTPAGPVPVVRTKLDRTDRRGALRARFSPTDRNNYKIAPGLYAVGTPNEESAVLVSCNYKLSFDAVRSGLGGLSVWILVLDTRGINVWCAAGKGTFGTTEVIDRVKLTGLEGVVAHRRLVLPQLGATGVSARGVKKGCGFEVVWGPVRAEDIKAFLTAGFQATPEMRRVTFGLLERLVLIPVELVHLAKTLGIMLAVILILSGLGPGFFSIQAAWNRGLWAALGLLIGVLAGTVLVPVLLPWIPGPAFSKKGLLVGLLGGLLVALAGWSRVGPAAGLALLVLSATVASFLAMTFTGSTPFTSPTGVEKEMRRAMPWQIAGLVVATAVWIGGAWVG